MPKVKPSPVPPNFASLEEEVMNWWREDNTFQKSVESRPQNQNYVFYDGPPFATGMPHYGHLLASTTKDVIPRYWTMKGFRVERVWGWDCHGLPIENMIEKELNIKGGKKGIEAMGIDKFNAACRSEVLRLDQEWEKVIERLGRWVDMKHNYKTMDKSYMESVWWGFKQLWDKGLVYEGKKVILYCPRCATPLSNFEIAMDNSYVDVTENSTTYKYKVKDQPNTYLLAWSTTPWNKLATPALAVKPNLEYVKVKQGSEFYVLANTRLSMLKDEPYEVKETFTGQDLANWEFELHFDFYPQRKTDEKAGIVVADDFVTDEEGTGIVTLAVYGEEDFRVMKQHHVQMIEHVDSEGKLKSEVKPWAGMDILTANPLIDDELVSRGLVYEHKSHTHSVATCYRCATRLYYSPQPAWFINVDALREQLIAQNEKINWVPAYLKNGRFKNGLENAPDWNVSRSRYWGTPMPIWQGKKGKEKIYRLVGSVEELKQWAVDPKQTENLDDIHREFLDHIEVWVDDQRTIKGTRISEVFDCWVESGSMPFASISYPFKNKEFFDNNYPAQFVSEYIAQTRAWFYTMHVMSVGIFGQPSFENVLTTGTILAEDGTKMSKSKKNYPDPMTLINTYGVDSLRMYLMSSTVMKGENLNFNEKDVADIRRKVFVVWWNVMMFFLSFKPTKVELDRPKNTPTHILDRWLVSRIDSLTAQVTAYMDAYDVVRSSRVLMEFVNEFSTWYLRLSRDRLRSGNNEESWQVFGWSLVTLAKLFAPLAPFFSETLHHTLVNESDSIHLANWPTMGMTHSFSDEQLESEMAVAQQAVEKAHAARKEQSIKVRQPLSSVTINSLKLANADELAEILKAELNVKNVIWQLSPEGIKVALDTKLTPELKLEGEARELARQIQQARKKLGLSANDQIELKVPSIPAGWEKYLKEKTNSVSIGVASEIEIKKI